MRILAHARSLTGQPRLARALVGLALRGHEVMWLGGSLPRPPEAEEAILRPVQGGPALARHTAEVVVGGPEPPAVAGAGWMVRARCMVLGLDADTVRRWGRVAHGAWSTLHAWGLIEEGDGRILQADAPGLDLDRIALWPPAPPVDEADAAHPDTEVLERTCERALARHRSRVPRPGVFVDRDGTLVIERGYLADPTDLELLPGTAPALHDLKTAGVPVIVVSNQSGVGRGLFSESRVYQAMARLRVELRAAGAEPDGIYFCPHRPEEGCACRKPGTRLLERAAADHLLNLRASFMVGDKLLDVETAHRAGAQGVLVRSGYGRTEERLLDGPEARRRPELVCDDLEGAVAWILGMAEASEGG